jgi:hypothetical protein
MPRDMVVGLGTTPADRLRRRRHLGDGPALDQAREDGLERGVVDIGGKRRFGVERIVERRRISEIDNVVDQHSQGPIAEIAILV